MFKGAGVMLVILGVLLFALYLWLSINPPFATPKTGLLHASAARDVRLGAGQTTLAIRLDARLNENAMRTTSGRPALPTLVAEIAPTVDGQLDGMEMRLLAGETSQPVTGVRQTATSRVEWTMPCPRESGPACRQWVVLLIEAPASDAERRWRLTVDGDVRYPVFVPTPGWSSFDLDLRAVGAETGMVGSATERAAGTAELTDDRPVVVVPVHVERGGARDPGGTNASGATAPPGANAPAAVLWFTMATERLNVTAPTGFDAPEPVRATLLAADGTVVTRLGVRPGDGGRTFAVPLPACAATCTSDYRIAFEWMDRLPDAEYRLTWRAQVIGLPVQGRSPATVALRVGDQEIPTLAAVAIAPPGDAGPLRGQGIDVRIGEIEAEVSQAHPLHVQMLVTATVDPTDAVGTTATAIRPASVEGNQFLRVPFDLLPGETGSIVVNLGEGCPSGLCPTWGIHATPPTVSDPTSSIPFEVTWQVEVRAWRLVADATPLALTVATQ
jgi:hypothetical protein